MTHTLSTIIRSRAIEADMDIQSDTAWLRESHDPMERAIVLRVLGRSQGIARRSAMIAQLEREIAQFEGDNEQDLADWLKRDAEENARHVRVQQRAQERCQILESLEMDEPLAG